MRTTKDKPGIRPAPLQYIIGMFALALVCFSLLCIYFYRTPAHASPGYQQANSMTMTGQIAFDDTETNTPSPTATNTPSPTATNKPSPTTTHKPSPTATTMSTPNPSPTVTRTTTPSPTSTWSATTTTIVQPSPAATGLQTPSPGATPTSGITSITTSTQGTGANQTPVASPAPTNNQGDQSSHGAHHPGNTFPFSALLIGLGSVVLLLPGWMIVRRRLLPRLFPKSPPRRAVPWSRTRTSDQQEQAIQYGALDQVSPFSQQGNATYNAPYDGTTTATPALYTSSAVSQPGGLLVPDSNPSASLNALPTMADVPVPNQPISSFRDHAASAAASPASHTNPVAGIGQSFDSPYLAERIRQRRNELRVTASRPAFQEQTPGELSADITELNDPYLQSLIQLYRERGRL
jgi:hypothetical protein